MAKAQFHKNQRVYVKPVGTWALIEHVVPHWAKGIDEPIRIHYDVGLGREFAAEELLSEEPLGDRTPAGKQHWRVVRARNKWQPAEDCARHPVPGTYPVVITGEAVTDGHPARPWATARFATLRDEVADALVAWHPEIDRDLAYQGAAAILGVMDGIQIQWLLDPDAVDLAETTAFAIEAIVAATIAGPKRQQPVPPPSA